MGSRFVRVSGMRRSAGALWVLALAYGWFFPAHTEAELIYGYTTGQRLFSFDSATPGTISTPISISGVVPGGQLLVGMDFRPATGELFALSYLSSTGAAQLYTIDLISAAATTIGSGFTLQSGVSTLGLGFDFDPVSDLIRVILGRTTGASSTWGANYRVNPNTGALAATDVSVAFMTGDPNFGTNPFIAGLAHSNNVPGSLSTTLYGYEYVTNSLVTVGNVNGTPRSPSDGVLISVGLSGIEAGSSTLDMDISPTTGFAYANIDGQPDLYDRLYRINLSTGGATLIGAIGTDLFIRDVAVFIAPEPGTSAIAVAAAGMFLFQRRRTRSTGGYGATIASYVSGRRSR